MRSRQDWTYSPRLGCRGLGTGRPCAWMYSTSPIKQDPVNFTDTPTSDHQPQLLWKSQVVNWKFQWFFDLRAEAEVWGQREKYFPFLSASKWVRGWMAWGVVEAALDQDLTQMIELLWTESPSPWRVIITSALPTLHLLRWSYCYFQVFFLVQIHKREKLMEKYRNMKKIHAVNI